MGDVTSDGHISALRQARLRRGMKRATVVRRMLEILVRQGEMDIPSPESLKRMHVYWENGDREVTRPAYQRAERDIRGAAGCPRVPCCVRS